MEDNSIHRQIATKRKDSNQNSNRSASCRSVARCKRLAVSPSPVWVTSLLPIMAWKSSTGCAVVTVVMRPDVTSCLQMKYAAMYGHFSFACSIRGQKNPSSYRAAGVMRLFWLSGDASGVHWYAPTSQLHIPKSCPRLQPWCRLHRAVGTASRAAV